jgi:quercetin dioxygenase-like cupin family protein
MTGGHRPTLLGRPIPDSIGVVRVDIPAGGERPTDPDEWRSALVVVEEGSVEVESTSGAARTFHHGDLLCLEWLAVRTLRNPGPEMARLVAIWPSPHDPHVTRADPEGDPRMKYRTTIASGGGNTTGIPVPDEVMTELGAGRKPAVTVAVGGHTYRSSVGTVDGRPMISLSAANREAAGVKAGDEVEVEVALDTAPREVTVPDDFAAALDAEPAARRTFDGLSYSNRRWHVESVTGAKTDETRQRRIAKSVDMLREGRAR